MFDCTSVKDDSSSPSDKITIEGFAKRAKRGPILVTEKDDVYYIKDFDYWKESLLDKKIRVEGYLIIEKDSIDDENIIKQSYGNSEIKCLEEIRWEIVEK
jgi:hypothetical protein